MKKIGSSKSSTNDFVCDGFVVAGNILAASHTIKLFGCIFGDFRDTSERRVRFGVCNMLGKIVYVMLLGKINLFLIYWFLKVFKYYYVFFYVL